jgi:potassium-dependent mechanosensitive channel
MQYKHALRWSVFFCCFLFMCLGIFAQLKQKHVLNKNNEQPPVHETSDTLKSKAGADSTKQLTLKKLILAKDTLTSGDYMLSIERVNDNLNVIGDSARLGFKVTSLGRRINDITNDVNLMRQNIRDRRSVINIKNLYLYQSFASNLNDENESIKARLFKMYHHVYFAKQSLKTAFSDSIFRLLYADSSLRNSFNRRLVRLERKWNRNDSTTKASIDTLNAFKVKVSDNSVNLSNMLNIMDNRLDRADKQLFGPEDDYLWFEAFDNDSTQKPVSILSSEQKAIGYYSSQTSGQRAFVIVLGIALFIWLFVKRKVLKTIREQEHKYGFLNLQYMNNYAVLSLFVLILCLMPFFDAYAPTSYIAIEHFLLLTAATVIFFKKEDQSFRFNWLILVILFVADVLTYVIAEPTFVTRVWLLTVHVGIIIFSFRFYRHLSKQTIYYRWIKGAVITCMILSGLAVICNLFGRISLSGIIGIAGIFALTQAVILLVFISTVIEIVLLQLESSRIKKGVDKPFDSAALIKRFKMPLIFIALILWLIMLTSNLNIYHSISNGITDFLTSIRTIGSISFKLISVFMFFAIIWFAHILQRLISFLFGETGSESEDMTNVSKAQHSRLLITRLLVLIGGYLLAIAASGLPVDKLTFLLGALGIGIGMGLQNMVNNFVSGIILIFDGSLKIGDEIEVSGQSGKVKEIGLRASRLNTADGAEVIIPNGNILSQNIVNWTSNDQKRVTLGFSLTGQELDSNVINEVINGTIKSIPDVISQRNPVILYIRVTPETYSLTVRFWSIIGKTDHVKSEARLRLSAAFAAKNIGFK